MKYWGPWLMAGVFAAVPAFAAEDAAEDKAAAAASAEEPTVLAPVVVKGEKIQRTQVETLSSVNVQSGVELEDSTARDLYDASTRVANVTENGAGYSIRGIPNQGVTSEDSSGLLSSVVVDGVALSANAASRNDVPLWDVEQVEFLRGPQSTNVGRNALAGALVVSTRDPVFDTAWAARAAGGSNGGRDLAFTGNVPLVDDWLALRAVYNERADEGEVTNVVRDDDQWNRERRRNARLKLLFQPGTDSVYRAVLGFSRQLRFESDPFGFVDEEAAQQGRRESRANEPAYADSSENLYSLKQDYKFSEHASLTAVSSVEDTKYFQTVDFDGTESADGTSFNREAHRNLAQELRVGFSGKRHKSVLGVYLADLDQDQNYGGRIAMGYIGSLVGACPDRASCDLLFAGQFIDYQQVAPRRIRNQAVFGETEYNFAHQWHLIAGLRYDRESQDRSDTVMTSGTSPAAELALEALIAGGFFAPDGTDSADTSFHALLPKIGLRREMGKNWNMGFSVQRAYRAGGASVNVARQETVPYGPEYTTNYEISLKGRSRDDRTHLNWNIYRIDWRDQQVSVGEFPDSQFVNAGRSHLHGTEIELRHAPLRSLEMYGALGYARTSFEEFDNNGQDLSGNEFNWAPHHTVSLGTAWRFLPDWRISVDGRRQGASYSEVTNDPARRIEAFTVLNSRLEWWPTFVDGLRMYVQATNITDRFYRVHLAGEGRTILGEGRAVYVGVEKPL